MPRVPILQASGVSLQTSAGSPPNVSITGALGEAFSKVGKALAGATKEWNAANENLQNGREAIQSQQIISDLSKSLEERSNSYTGDSIPNESADDMKQYGETYLGERMKGVKMSELGQQRLRLHAADIISRSSIATRHRVTGLNIERGQSDTYAAIDEFSTKGDLESYAMGQTLVRDMRTNGYFTAEQARSLNEKLRTQTINSDFARRLEADPNAALTAANAKEGVLSLATEPERMHLVGTARTAIEHQESRERQKLADLERAQTKFDKEIKKIGDAARLDATILAMDGKLNVEQVETLARVYRWKPNEYQHLRELVTNPKGGQSDPDVFQSAMLRARSTNVTQDDRDWFATMYQAKRLSAEDYAKVDNEAQTNIRQKTDEAKSDAGRLHNQAEQELRAGLGITGLLETLTQDQKKAYSSALQELTERSNYMRGKENPLTVVRDLIPRYQKAITDNAVMSAEQKLKVAIYKTPQELESAWKAGRISKELYQIERQRLMEVGAYAPDLLRMNRVDKSPTKSSGNPSLKRETK